MSDSKHDPKHDVHVYDGIEEHDHRPPFWFNALFLGTIIFGVIYAAYYLVGDGPGLIDEYKRDQTAEMQAVYAAKAAQPVAAVTEDSLLAVAKDPARVQAGAQSYAVKCASCHGAKGQGGIGPNLTDDYWIHGATLVSIHKTIQEGVADKGMPQWGATLPADEVGSLVAFVHSVHGTNPEGAKEPQGEKAKN